MVIGSVLMTDMTQHFQLLEKFSRARSKQPDINKWEDRDVVLQLILHTADISNPFRVPRLATLWGELVTQEFIQQVGLGLGMGGVVGVARSRGRAAYVYSVA